MSSTVAVLALALAYKPLGDYMARVFTAEKHLAVERAVYRVGRVNADAEQNWKVYAASVLGAPPGQHRAHVAIRASEHRNEVGAAGGRPRPRPAQGHGGLGVRTVPTPGDRDTTTGLGLSVAKGFVETMGGTLRAEDTPGGGLTMVVALPAALDSVAATGERFPGQVSAK